MEIATNYPFLSVVWTIMVFFAWVAYIWLLIVLLGDLFRRTDVGGWAKAAWVVFMIVLPFVGILTYLVLEHAGMAERSAADADRAQQQADAYVRSSAGADGAAGEIEKAKRLADDGTISQSEFETIKAKALAAH